MEMIGLLDCNNFFVSCERLFRPDLKHRPVVVLSSNDGCVVARSAEIKDRGIPMGVPYFQIKDILSDMKAEVFSSHFSLYRDISRRVFNTVEEYLGSIERYSIDECFFKVEAADAERVASELKDLVWQRVGIPVSVGVAASKTQAKYANSLAKKTMGACVLSKDEWEKKIKQINLTELWGVGRSRTQHFSQFGLKTVFDYLALSEAKVGQLFGVEGVRLRAELMGQVTKGLGVSCAAKQTLTSSRSFAATTNQKSDIKAALFYHLQQVVKAASQQASVLTKLRVLMYPGRYSDFAFKGASIELSLALPTLDLYTLESLVNKAVDAHFKLNVPYKKAGIVGNVMPAKVTTESLFPINETTNQLTKTLLNINKHYGKAVLQLGTVAAVKNERWQARRDNLSPAYTTNWSDIKTVSAKT